MEPLKKTKTGKDPYVAAREEWNERYGSYISAANTWKLVAIVCLIVAGISVGGAIYFASQGSLIPYIVEVDGKGRVIDTYPLKQPKVLTPDVIKAQLAQFVTDIKTVTADADLQVKGVKRAYAYLDNTSPAYLTINQYFQNNTPFTRATKETITVEIKQVLPISEKSWRIEWIEHKKTNKGIIISEEGFTGTASIKVANVLSETALLNPVGLYIESFDWAKNLN